MVSAVVFEKGLSSERCLSDPYVFMLSKQPQRSEHDHTCSRTSTTFHRRDTTENADRLSIPEFVPMDKTSSGENNDNGSSLKTHWDERFLDVSKESFSDSRRKIYNNIKVYSDIPLIQTQSEGDTCRYFCSLRREIVVGIMWVAAWLARISRIRSER